MVILPLILRFPSPFSLEVGSVAIRWIAAAAVAAALLVPIGPASAAESRPPIPSRIQAFIDGTTPILSYERVALHRTGEMDLDLAERLSVALELYDEFVVLLFRGNDTPSGVRLRTDWNTDSPDK